MTRSEFIENVQCWDDLMEMASEYDCEPLYNIHHRDDLDDVVCDAIRDCTYNTYWYEIRDSLSNIDIYEAYFRDMGFLEYDNLDEGTDFQEYKGYVLSWGDREEIWDSEEDDWIDEENHEKSVGSSSDYGFARAYGRGNPGECCSEFEAASIADLLAIL